MVQTAEDRARAPFAAERADTGDRGFQVEPVLFNNLAGRAKEQREGSGAREALPLPKIRA